MKTKLLNKTAIVAPDHMPMIPRPNWCTNKSEKGIPSAKQATSETNEPSFYFPDALMPDAATA